MKNNFKEKAYKLLHEKYKRLYTVLRTRAENVVTYGQNGDAIKFLQTVVEDEANDLHGILSKTDKEVIRLLEYLVNDDEPIR